MQVGWLFCNISKLEAFILTLQEDSSLLLQVKQDISMSCLWEHLKVHHLNKLLYQCPFDTCNMNLKHLDGDLNDIQDHLDQHSQLGEKVAPAAWRGLPTSQPAPLPRGEQLCYRLISQLFTCPQSSPSDILEARERVTYNPFEPEFFLFGSLLTDEWLEEEGTTDASSKERRIRLTGALAKQQSSRAVPKLETPPLSLFHHTPKHPIASVGFNSPGFYQKAHSAFQKVEEDVDMEDN
ncbi:unnamed protein product [Rhizoctonia solani]|uniref:C2H2-type domain-containing protein n=1 Tax=Rhizoctonia solani TaxID=456999 RepID=A0A8H3GP01_9AGAM|nr:unnamed protein product [Rhizoctonia solani]